MYTWHRGKDGLVLAVIKRGRCSCKVKLDDVVEVDDVGNVLAPFHCIPFSQLQDVADS